MPRSAAMKACRRVCASTPFLASIMMMASVAVDAPVAILRVYCSWPGGIGDDEFSPVRSEVAVSHVDGDALLAFRRKAVNQEREIKRVALRAEFAAVGGKRASWSSKISFDSYNSRPMRVDLPSSTDPQVIKRSVFVSLPCHVAGNVGLEKILLQHQKYPACFLSSIEAPASLSITRPCRSDVLDRSIS